MADRLPSQREEKAVKRGADELMVLAEWHFRKKPRVLKRWRKEFAGFCTRLYSALERSYQRQTGSALRRKRKGDDAR
jgi:hypothetical protein